MMDTDVDLQTLSVTHECSEFTSRTGTEITTRPVTKITGMWCSSINPPSSVVQCPLMFQVATQNEFWIEGSILMCITQATVETNYIRTCESKSFAICSTPQSFLRRDVFLQRSTRATLMADPSRAGRAFWAI